MADRLRVLIVDDEPPIRRAVAEILEELDHAVVVAASAGEALDVLAAQPFDVVLTDVVMPVTSGLVLAQRVRTDYPEIDIIFMSGEVEPDIVEELGAVAFVHKPFGVDALADAINACCAGRK